MTIKELIEKLKIFDPKTRVVVGGFDDVGFTEALRVEGISVIPRKCGIECAYDYPKSKEEEAQALKVLLIDHD
jgi:hypothetical protein